MLPLLALNDLHGYVLIELYRGCAATQDAPDAPTERSLKQQALKRLIDDVFDGDVRGAFREYCAEEPALAAAIAMLDGMSAPAGSCCKGWSIAVARGELVGSVSAQGLLDSCSWFK